MPAVEVFRRYPRQVFTAMGLRVAENGGSYIFLAFALAYGKFLGIPGLMLGGVLASMFVELGTLVWFGHLSDRIGRRAVYLIGAAGLMLVAFRSSGWCRRASRSGSSWPSSWATPCATRP